MLYLQCLRLTYVCCYMLTGSLTTRMLRVSLLLRLCMCKVCLMFTAALRHCSSRRLCSCKLARADLVIPAAVRPLQQQMANLECNAVCAVAITHHFLTGMARARFTQTM